MSARIVLVTGSRALVGSPREYLARALLTSALSIEPDSTVIVTGDAPGPDEWAREHTMPGSLFEHPQRIWSLDGWIYDEHGSKSKRWDCGHEAERSNAKQWPLLRNRLMVRSCAARARDGAVVEVLALEAEWSKTHGTGHTVNVARDCGLAIVRIAIPAVSSR